MITGPKKTIERAKKLRREMTLPEILLWQELRKRPEGFKFRKQHPSGDFVADFYCHEARLVVEVDGETHSRGDQPNYDIKRDAWFAARGIMALRIPAKVVLSDMQSAVATIIAAANDRMSPLRLAYGDPPPLAGEDFSGSNSWIS